MLIPIRQNRLLMLSAISDWLTTGIIWRQTTILTNSLPDSHFDEVLACYYFDKDLKALLFKAIQTIEVAFKDNLTTELALGTIDCNPAHHWHDAVVPSPRHPVSWSLPSPYLCSRRTVPQMCFCSCFLLVFKFRLQNYYLFLVLSLCKI